MKEIPIQKIVSGITCHPKTIVRATIGYATVDDKHYDELIQYNWTLCNGYARRGKSKSKGSIYIQHDIWCRLENRPYIKLDHIDRNPLNNQINNLRPATWSQNNMNMGLRTDSTTGFKGVTWNKEARKYQAQIMINKKNIALGLFYTALEAAKAYDTAAIEYFGEFALTNESLGVYICNNGE